MKIDITSMFFNSRIEGQTATPAWGTSIGQNKSRACRIDDFKKEVVDMVIGMTYKSVADLSNLDVSKGSGNRDIVTCSVFENVYINNQKIENTQYVLLLVREHSKSHDGRLLISYAPYIKYNGIENQSCIDLMQHKLGCTSEGCWFVYDISIKNQSELYFSAVVVNASAPMVYSNSIKSKNRSEEWKALIPADGEADSILQKTLSESLQQIFYGAPGTGKSHIIKEQTKNEEVIRTTFHPDTDYSTFVGAYKPTTEFVPVLAIIGDKAVETGRQEKRISYEFVSQAFLQAYVGAWKKVADADGDDPKKQFLVIEEINRGNCAQIFGDLFQLLDRNDYGFSDYPIKADADMQKQLKRLFEGVMIDNADSINALYNGRDIVREVLDGEVLLLPSNLYIWATMNTSDQSLFPIDSAFKRRWDWQYMPISDGGKNWKIEADTQMYSWWSFIQKINDEIYAKTNSEDKKLGYYFCKPTNGIVKVETFVSKVLFYLWNDVFKDFDEENGLFAESYDKFFDTDSKGRVFVVKEKVQAILESLKVEVVGDIDESEDATETSEMTQQRSKDKFMLNGEGRFGKSRIALEALKKYASANPSASAADIVAAWTVIGIPNLIETSETHAERETRSTDNRMADKWNELHLANGEYIYLSNQFPNDRIYTFITSVNSQPWGVRIEKIVE